MRRIGMGLVGPGFVGAHHIDAVRRLGFVDVVAVAASSDRSARAKADALGVPKGYGSYEALAADPDVHVVHNTTPNNLHVPVIMAALTHRKHVVSDKPLALNADDARSLLNAAREAGVVHAVTFNYRGNPLVQQAREMIRGGEIGEPHFVHGAYLQDWLLQPTDFSWRLEPEKGGKSSAIGDIGSHWCDLVQHVVGRPIEAVLADLSTVVTTRFKPSANREAFAHSEERGDPFRVQSEDLATVLVRFEGGARGSVCVGQVCAGHKNDLWFEVNGRTASLRWLQERQNELWIGRRDGANAVLPKDPSLLHEGARRYAHLPGGHQEAWADAFCNVMRDIYGFIASGRGPDEARPPAFATFDDGYRAACVVDSILKSHADGGIWTDVRVLRGTMKLGLFTPVFAKLSVKDMLAKVRSLGKVTAIELGTGAWPGSDHVDVDAYLKDKNRATDFRKMVNDAGLTISALSCHGNPLHPDPARCRADDEIFRKTVQLAERLEVPVVVTFSGCPGDSETATHPNWVTTPWPPEFLDVLEWQWEKRAIPYWTKTAAFARDHGIKVALEAHPGFIVYNVESALKLRSACGDSLGVNFDPSHFFWQGVDVPSAIRALGSSIFHVHAKDVYLDRQNVAVNGVLDTKTYRRMPERSWLFRSVGFGHDEFEWKRIVSALRLSGYDYVMSIEHEDALASIDEGLKAAIDVLSRALLTEPPVEAWWT